MRAILKSLTCDKISNLHTFTNQSKGHPGAMDLGLLNVGSTDCISSNSRRGKYNTTDLAVVVVARGSPLPLSGRDKGLPEGLASPTKLR